MSIRLSHSKIRDVLTDVYCRVSSGIDAYGNVTFATGSDAMYHCYDYQQCVYLYADTYLNRWREPHFEMKARVHRTTNVSRYEAHAFDYSINASIEQITSLTGPYITDKFLDDLSAKYPSEPDIECAIVQFRRLMATHYDRELYMPAHDISI